ncbi:nuclear distribution protein PAC1 [Paracoccidioides brasiliensis Pb18]|uniref:Nuclear distribution protein PAC1 n=1 Tax=Paracoccidioides brasiliensis (strain Pb18) TaxID=502780 RepID=C1G2A0_PARBD|nr:nuclear distribution protein PAC1 [Paracoccidioides brasiliensis Pb18]EEH46116.2 nuclear distribution protein PAC1 [Paracoccidioides brasiliensis Pb18]
MTTSMDLVHSLQPALDQYLCNPLKKPPYTIKLRDNRGTCLLTLEGHDNWDLSQERKCIKMLSDVHDGFVNCLRRAPGTVKDVPAVYSGASGRKNDEGNGTLGAQRDKRGTIQVQMRSIRRHGRGGFKAEDFPRTEVAGDDPEPTDAYCCSSFIFRSCQLVLFQEK